MLRAERQAKILRMVHEQEFVQTDELARALGVSRVTIRRDLRSLSEQNLIRLDHGGSAAVDYLEGLNEPLYDTKVYLNHEQKETIGAAAVAIIQDNDTVILDSGTTNAQIARHLRHSTLHSITVITCDLMVAKILCPEPEINVLVLGGILRHSYYSAYGPYTESILRNVKANKFFLGIDAASMENGISNIVLEEVPVKQLSMQASDRTIMVADSTKLGHNAAYRVCGWDQIDEVITDTCVSPEIQQFLMRRGISCHVVAASCENVVPEEE